MTGLLKKDYFLLKSNLKTYITVVLFYIILGGAALFDRFFSDNAAISDMLSRCGEQLPPFLPIIIPAVLLTAIVISYRAAIDIIDKKDF